MLIFLLKGALPEVYRERYEVSGGAKPIQVVGYDPNKLAHLTTEQVLMLKEALQAIKAKG